MKEIRRLLSLVLAIVMCMACFAVAAAEYEYENDNLPNAADLLVWENKTTGYRWFAKCDNEGVVKVTDTEYHPQVHGECELGAGGARVFHLESVASGTTVLTFYYARDENGDPVQTIRYDLEVDANNRINILDFDDTQFEIQF